MLRFVGQGCYTGLTLVILCGCANDIYLGSRRAPEIETEFETESSLDSNSESSIDTMTEPHESDTDPTDPVLLNLEGDLDVLDPTIIEFDNSYVIFHTGPGISVKRSDDLITWRADTDVFNPKPDWIVSEFPDTDRLWGPDISFFGGAYHLYYGVSTFGSNVSCIGHAVTNDLGEGMRWTDLGKVICTTSADTWNAIDPNWTRDENGDPWMVLGSYWTGIKAVRLDESGTLFNDTVVDISSRGEDIATAAPLVVRRNDTFYHFVSFDQCCMGIDSTHNIRVGRADTFLGPYLDFDGVSMLDGGGTLILEGDSRWRGPGHNAVFESGGIYYNVYHAYDTEKNGMPTLRISTMVWDADGRPRVAGP